MKLGSKLVYLAKGLKKKCKSNKNLSEMPSFTFSYILANTRLIIKITISSIVIGLKNTYFPLIHLPSCYRTVCYWTVQ